MPYGVCNTPAMFQRLMQNCLGELNLTYALVYLDDVIVYSNTEEDHLHQLQAVFERFHEHGLKVKPSKCSFLCKQITFLGHEVSADGMRPGDLNLKGIAEIAPPANYTEVLDALIAGNPISLVLAWTACLCDLSLCILYPVTDKRA